MSEGLEELEIYLRRFRSSVPREKGGDCRLGSKERANVPFFSTPPVYGTLTSLSKVEGE